MFNIIEKYLDAEAYGGNLIIKKFAHFPRYLPLPAHIEHGWTAISNALNTDLSKAENKGLMLVFSSRRLVAWQKASKVPAVIIGAPFVIYRQQSQIKKSKTAKGTISFPSHSTINSPSHYDIKRYCRELKSLPAKFQPVTICLLQPDIDLGRDKVYQNEG